MIDSKGTSFFIGDQKIILFVRKIKEFIEKKKKKKKRKKIISIYHLQTLGFSDAPSSFPNNELPNI